MLNVLLFWSISAFFFYIEIKRLSKLKLRKDLIFFLTTMTLAVILISLGLFGIKFPYIVSMVEAVTKPVSDPIGQWLKSYRENGG
ncbi:hypothetical protein SAMN04487944_10386 [Gracilibacillus ureilyticus]|uniref:Uncharacterized protein n=1 Tax=Gracilibacillus ureilyticus TaxID=531814 RepID=A0A1H9NDX3_9BACI|nr:hypothetical protein [Gracilibacillus ureilyticus]SER33937.1 hypothetical protein SAMN04487944_10386 [Gracilibacillus ureilyticus]